MSQNLWITRIVLFILSVNIPLLPVFLKSSFAQESATLSWAPNQESDLAGYKLYYGKSTGVYKGGGDQPSPTSTGNTTSQKITGLTPGEDYYFTLTAIDFSGNESIPSEEISAVMPSLPSPPPSPSGPPSLSDDFADGNMAGWTVVDEGTHSGHSTWAATTGALTQRSNIYDGNTNPAALAKRGTFAWYGIGLGWSDYQATVNMSSTDNDALGVMVRYQDPNNYYRFSWDRQRAYRRLVKVHNGVFTLLAGDAVPYVEGQTYQMKMQVEGTQLTVMIDGATIFNVTDSSLATGTVALYTWANDGARFDDVQVTPVTTAGVFPLSVSVSGSGVVTSSPGSINCPSNSCSTDFDNNTSVTLTATPGSGATFSQWGGACSGTSPLCMVTLDNAQSVSATFMSTPPPPVTLSVSLTGKGTVTSSPGSINCPSNSCSADFDNDTLVTLTATPSSGTSFSQWGGACSGTSPLCMVTLDNAQSVTATFMSTPPPSVTLSVSLTGKGTVTSSPGNINCPSNSCSADIDKNTSVTLTATPGSGATFSQWGGACSGTGSCVVSMTADRTITATFITSSPPPVPPSGPPSLTEDFTDGDLGGWTVVDEGTHQGPSTWSASTGILVQNSNIYTHPINRSSLEKQATHIFYNDGMSWTDYHLGFSLQSKDNDAVGVMIRYQDSNNYYRFSWDKQRNYRRLVKVHNGVFTLLAGDAVPYVEGRTYQVEMHVEGSRLDVMIDGATIFNITDNSLSAGTVALYSWANDGSRFDDVQVTPVTVTPPTAPPSSSPSLTDDFADGNIGDWTVVDEGTHQGPSAWSASTGTLVQNSNIYTYPITRSSLEKQATHIFYNGGMSWTDYRLGFSLQSDDNDAVGVMVRYQDSNNYYRFSWDKQRHYRRLVKCENGVFFLLAEDTTTYQQGKTYTIEVEAKGDTLDVLVDGTPVFSVNDSSLSTGTIAFYSWANRGSKFDNVKVENMNVVE